MKLIQLNTKSKIELNNDSFIIDDKSARTNKLIFLALPFLFISYSFYTLNVGINSSNVINKSVLIFCSVSFFFLTFYVFPINLIKRSNRKNISLSDITDVKFKKSILGSYIDIKLDNNLTRRITNVNDSKWLNLKEYLKNSNIKCSE